MTATECINYIDAIEPNAYNETQKLGWLSECEGKVYTGLFLVQPYEFTPVTEGSRILALPAPYDRIYPRYLQAMIHYANGEYDRYANSMAVFNEAWGELNRWFGGDYDVTDRLRNRRFEMPIKLSNQDQVIFTIPEGGALAAARIVVRKESTYASSNWYYSPAAMPAGTYNFRCGVDWFNFTTTEDYAAGTQVTFIEHQANILVYPAGEENSVQYALTNAYAAGGTDIQIEEPTSILMDDDPIDEFRADIKGAHPLPMLIGSNGGSEIKLSTYWKTIWNDDGSMYFTGHLLIPDERWSYEDKYARRRDARWQS